MCAASPTDPLANGLYLVGTPIGNLGDFTTRARAVLEAVDLIAAEDTRSLKRLPFSPPSTQRTVSLTEHNTAARIPAILSAAAEGAVALTSDAGMPAIADPGQRLVEAAHMANIPVFVVPGPTAMASALAVSGFPVERGALFAGFVPRSISAQRELFERAASCASVLVFYESPGRLAATLQAVAEILNDPVTVVCRELTKHFETVHRDTASRLAVEMKNARGEVVVVVRLPIRNLDVERTAQLMAAMQRAGARRSAAAAEVAHLTGVARASAYESWPADSP